jgi:hypothetical protein
MQYALGLWEWIGVGDAHKVKAKRMRSLAEMLRQRAARYGCD